MAVSERFVRYGEDDVDWGKPPKIRRNFRKPISRWQRNKRQRIEERADELHRMVESAA
jgi:hypothetical protein